jgi:DNA-binding HxlR family transcriptional regulator
MDTLVGSAPHHVDDERFCPVTETMRLLEQKWTLQIVKELVGGKRRFCQLQHALRGDSRHGNVRDVNPKTLSQRLKTLEAYGIVTRRMISDIPPNVEYELTCRGHDLAGIIDRIDVWARKWMHPVDVENVER